MRYECPICHEKYDSLDEMYSCAKKCEQKDNFEMIRKQKKDEIITRFNELSNLVKNYNEINPTAAQFEVKLTEDQGYDRKIEYM